MRACVQRVREASVTISGEVVGRIGQGMLVLLGVGQEDSEADVHYLADKLIHLRVFEDDAGKMNLSLTDIGGAMLVVSQFTLYGDCRQGRRPGFSHAAAPAVAEKLYEAFVTAVGAAGIKVETGRFPRDDGRGANQRRPGDAAAG